MRCPEREVVPEVLAPADPCSGDEALPVHGDHAHYVRFVRGPLTPAELRDAEDRFHALYLALLAGEATRADLAPVAARLGVDGATKHDRRPLPTVRQAVPDEVLSDAVEDKLPDWRVLVERVTGDPFARPAVAHLAALAYVPYTDSGRRPVDAWSEEEPDRDVAIAARAIDRSPPMLWRDGAPLLPLAPRMHPGGGPPGVYVARAYRTASGWAWSARVPLPATPAVPPLLARLELELWRVRLVERRASWEDMLRRRPEVVYRACAEQASTEVAGVAGAHSGQT